MIKQEVGSSIQTKQRLSLERKKTINLRRTNTSTDGTLNIKLQGDINIQESRNQETLASSVKTKTSDVITTTTTITRHHHNYDLAEGSNLDANNQQHRSESATPSHCRLESGRKLHSIYRQR